MRALVFDRSLRVETEVASPVPREDEALVRVRVAGICGTDLEIVRGYKGFAGILGHEFVGEVIAAPEPDLMGRRVCGEITIGCGRCRFCVGGLRGHCERRRVLGILNHPGAFADLLTLPCRNLHPVPDALGDRQAVFAEPLAAAMEMTEQVGVRPRMNVAVVGDGRLGNLCAQVMARTGAEVTAFGRHGRKLALLEGRGITAGKADLHGSAQFDVVVEATGSPSGLEAALRLVRPRGTLILKSTYAGAAPVDLSPAVVNEVTIVGSRCGPLPRAIDALTLGEIEVTELIDAIYPLEQGIAAFEHADRPGTMKVLLTMGPDVPC
jgi:threonine dehydrogenase-like Zn-dependent dehydrogenase